jgi:hypothetical protein
MSCPSPRTVAPPHLSLDIKDSLKEDMGFYGLKGLIGCLLIGCKTATAAAKLC